MVQNAAARVAKNASALFVGTACRIALSFFFVVYVARYLGLEGFGKYALTQHYFDLFVRLCGAGLSILVTREISKKPTLANEYVSAALVLVAGMSLLAGGLFVLLSRALGYTPDTQAAMLIASFAILPAALGTVFEATFVAFERAEFVSCGNVLESALRVGLGLLALLLGYGLLALFAALIAARMCTLLVYVILLKWRVPDLRWHFEWASLRKLVAPLRVFAAETWLSTLHSNLAVVALSVFHGEVAVGVFVAAAKVLRVGTVVAASYTTAVFPYMSRLFQDSKDKLRRLNMESLKYILMLVLPAVVTVNMLAERIITLLYTKEYTASIAVLRVLILVLLLDFLNPFLSHTLFARGQQSMSLRVAVAKLAFSATLPLWLIYRWGAIGTAWATLLSYGFAFCLYFVFAMGISDARQTLRNLPRIALPACVLAVFLWQFQDAQIVLLLASGGALYMALLLAFRAFSFDDLKLLQSLR